MLTNSAKGATNVRGVTIASGEWYARTLEVCLWRNMRHFSECLVVTSPDDEEVQAVAGRIPGVRLFVTDAMHRHGASFNKGLALELGFDYFGRDGWLCIHDADVLFPDNLPLGSCVASRLYGARRRVCLDPSGWTPDAPWAKWPRHPDNAPIGFFQLFHASAVADKRPWYDVSFAHAGGGDAAFMHHWSRNDWIVLPFDVLHLGPPDLNWFGTNDEGRDMMARFVTDNGWHRAARNFTAEQAARAKVPVERVDVPGYEPSTFELPFVRKARRIRANNDLDSRPHD